jgi:hypothetical protein
MWIGYSHYIPGKTRIVQIVVAKPACITGPTDRGIPLWQKVNHARLSHAL